MHKEPFGYEVAHHGYLLTSGPGLIYSIVYSKCTVKASVKSFKSSQKVFNIVFGKIQYINHNSNILPRSNV